MTLLALHAVSKAYGALKVTDDITLAVAATVLATVVGPVKWGGAGPFKNVSKSPLVLGEWNKVCMLKLELSIVNTEAATTSPTAGTLKLL